MQLLTPDKLKSDRKEEQDKIQRRDIAIAEEENRLVSSLNLTRDSVDEQKVELAADLEKFKAEKSAEKAVITADLEKRREELHELMQPIDQIRADTDLLLASAKELEKQAGNALEAVKAREQRVGERESAIVEAEKGILDRENAIVPQEKGLDEREKRILESFQRLSDAQDAQHLKVIEEDKRIADAIAKNEADAKHNAAVRVLQDERQKRQEEEDRKIASNYQALAAAQREIAKSHENTQG